MTRHALNLHRRSPDPRWTALLTLSAALLLGACGGTVLPPESPDAVVASAPDTAPADAGGDSTVRPKPPPDSGPDTETETEPETVGCTGPSCCSAAADCDDGNPCTDDACLDSECTYTDLEGECAPPRCESGVAVAARTCQAGACIGGGESTVCVASGLCEVGACAADAPACAVDFAPEWTPCGGGSCQDGVVSTGMSCDGAGACVEGAATGPCPGGYVCLDGQSCRTGCEVDEHCADGFFCGWGVCLPVRPDGAECDDGVECESGYCGSGYCCSGGDCCDGTASACDDQNPCTDDVCAGFVCEYTDNNAQCAAPHCDGGQAVSAMFCAGGSCSAGGATTGCGGSVDPCWTGTCDAATGTCVSVPAMAGTACNDGNACTQLDTCQSGTCIGTNPVQCAGADACHEAGSCNPATGACTQSAKPNGAWCNDGNACTQTDTCQGGTCTGTNPVQCAAPNACHEAGLCNPATGACTQSAKPNGAWCNDGNACTQTDTCQGGQCVGGAPVVCAANGSCELPGTCNPATGGCSTTPRPNGTACQDGDPCTLGDACSNGSCVGGGAKDCTSGLVCIQGTCNSNGCAGMCPAGAPPICDQSLKPGWCLINGNSCIPAGALNGPCQICDPAKDPLGWSPFPAGCNIGGNCYPAGSKNPGDECQVCAPTKSMSAWSQCGQQWYGPGCGSAPGCVY